VRHGARNLGDAAEESVARGGLPPCSLVTLVTTYEGAIATGKGPKPLPEGWIMERGHGTA
jgi:hypothetical protein